MHKRNIMLQLSYDGYSYLGWQRLGDQQKNKSIQGIVETQLSSLLGEDVRIVGSGRTDAGVHAFAQVANFYTESKLACDVIKKQLNKGLPDDIKVHTVNEVLMNFHSRFSAKGKVYRYYIDNEIRESVFARQYSYHIEEKLNLDAMRKAAALLVGTHNFYSFKTSAKGDIYEEQDCIRTIHQISIKEVQNAFIGTTNLIMFELYGDGFLYNMVRIIVGTLVEVGLGKRDVQQVTIALQEKDRKLAGYTVPPQGLFLTKVMY